MSTHRKITEKRLDRPLSPSTKTELLDLFHEIRDLLKALCDSQTGDTPIPVWQAIGSIGWHVDEALNLGVAAAADRVAFKAGA